MFRLFQLLWHNVLLQIYQILYLVLWQHKVKHQILLTNYNEYKDLEKPFLDFAISRGMVGVKGHRSVGGFRASCYNAQTMEGVNALVACMKEFEANH